MNRPIIARRPKTIPIFLKLKRDSLISGVGVNVLETGGGVVGGGLTGEDGTTGVSLSSERLGTVGVGLVGGGKTWFPLGGTEV